MEYTNNEKQILSLMERTDFRNLSKNDVLSYASKLNELRPEVAQQVIAQFPELAKLIQSTMVEYKDILEKIVASDDESTNQVYGIINKEVDNASDSKKEFIEYADKVRADLSKCLDNPNLTPEQQKDILDRQMEISMQLIKRILRLENMKWKWLAWQIRRIPRKKSLIGKFSVPQVLLYLQQ